MILLNTLSDVRYRANVKLVSANNLVGDMFLRLSGASAG